MSSKPFVIAEVSCNHLQNYNRCIDIIDAAVESGASAVKFQFWDYLTLDKSYTLKVGPWKGQNLYNLYEKAKTPLEWMPKLFAYCFSRSICCFASVFDVKTLELLERMACPIYKIASPEIVDTTLIHAVARTGKPIIISTGMASSEEIDRAVKAAQGVEITLLHCISGYPTPPENADLWKLRALKNRGFRVGISDHSQGIGVAVAAVALGAEVVEKHLTISRDGPDKDFSLLPEEFKELVVESRRAYQAVNAKLGLSNPSEAPQRQLRRSLYFAKSLKSGHELTREDFCTARPALGLEIKELNKVIGKVLTRDVKAFEPVKKSPLCGG